MQKLWAMGLALWLGLGVQLAQAQTQGKQEADRILREGVEAYRQNQYQSARELWERSLKIYTTLQDQQGIANSSNNLGLVYRALGDYPKALSFYAQSQAIRQSEVRQNCPQNPTSCLSAQRALGAVLNNQGVVYRFLGQYQRAIDHYQESLAWRQRVRDLVCMEDRAGEPCKSANQLVAGTLNNLGISYELQRQWDKATNFYQQSIDLKQNISDRQGVAISLNNLGNVALKQEQYPAALRFYTNSLAIKQEGSDRRSLAITQANLGNVYGKFQQRATALEFLQSALAVFQELGDRSGSAGVLSNTARTYSELGQTELAIVLYKQSVNLREAIRQDLTSLSRDEQQTFLATVEQDYRRLADLLLQAGRVTEALQVLDLLKVQELEDFLQNIQGNVNTGVGVPLLPPEQAITDWQNLADTATATRLNQQLRQAIAQLSPQQKNPIPQVLRRLPQGTALLYPLILPDRLELILFTAEQRIVRRSVKVSQQELEDLILLYRADLRDYTSQDVKNSAQKLYRYLYQPLAPDLQGINTILYAPDGRLRYVPLTALYDGKQWLIQKHRVANLIAYNLTDFSPRAPRPLNILAGAFGGKLGENRFGQQGLPATVAEVASIKQIFPNTVELREQGFSRQAVEQNLGRHTVIHLATHGALNPGEPEQSFIIFGNGDKLRLRELKDWRLPAQSLVVLSACQTGTVGVSATGIEVLGFGYQVQLAGAEEAVASLWTVSDQGTQVLMAQFYRQLGQGQNVLSALQTAQISLIRSNQFSHPYYWSAFFAVGNGR